MDEKDDKSWIKVEPLIPNPDNLLHAAEEDDEPTHTLAELLDKHTCPLCGTEFYYVRLIRYKKKLYNVCESCEKLNERERNKRFREIENQRNDK